MRTPWCGYTASRRLYLLSQIFAPFLSAQEEDLSFTLQANRSDELTELLFCIMRGATAV